MYFSYFSIKVKSFYKILIKVYTCTLISSSNQQDQNRIIDRKKHISSMQTKTTITVDTSKARSNLEVVTECVKKLEWQDCPSGLNNQNCDIIWLSINQEFEPIYNSLQSQVKINKFPCKLLLLEFQHSINEL